MNSSPSFRLFFLSFLLALIFLCSLTVEAQFSTWRKKLHGAGLCVGLNPLNPNTVLAEGEPGTFYISFDKGKTWNKRTDPGINSIRQIIVHPGDTNTIFCAAGYRGLEGLRKSTDLGQTWYTVISNYGIDGESIVYDPLHPDTMFAASFQPADVFRSTDRGETWTLMGNAGSSICGFAIRPDSGNILLSGSGGGKISKSTNYGATWRVVKNGTAGGAFQETPKIVVNPKNPFIAYATTYGAIDSTLDLWKTTDGGESWFRTALQKTALWALELDETEPDILYVGSFSEELYTIFKSTDGGDSWSKLDSPLLDDGYMWNLKIHPLDPSVIWLGMTEGTFGVNGVYRYQTTTTSLYGAVIDITSGDTIKNGTIRVPLTNDFLELDETGGMFQLGFFEEDSTLTPIVSTEAYPYFIADDTLNFLPDSTIQKNIYMMRLPKICFQGLVEDSATQSPTEAVVSLYYSTLNGDSVKKTLSEHSGEFRFDSLFIPYPPIIEYTKIVVDPGLPYAQNTFSNPQIDSMLVFDMRKADLVIVKDSSTGSFENYYTTIFSAKGIGFNVLNIQDHTTLSLSRATELKKKIVIVTYGVKNTGLEQSVIDSLLIAMNTGCNLLLTGQNFVEYNDTTELFNQLGIHFAGNSTIAYSKGNTGELFNNLGFFTTGPGGANNQSSRDILMVSNPGARIVLGYGPTATSGNAAVRIDSIGAGGKAIIMGFGFEAIAPDTMRRNIMEKIIGYFDGSIILGVENDNSSTPTQFYLGQNYPNPFNPVTTIRFNIPKVENHSHVIETHSNASVTLKVFNLLGQEVATLVNENKSPGEYSIIWDARQMSSGVYYYQLTAGSNIQTKKMLLMR